MKNLPLWTDTVFAFFSLFLLSFCLLRFSLPAGGALALALFLSAGAATLLHLFLRRRRKKKGLDEDEREKVRRFAIHLALDSPAHNADLLAKSLNVLQRQENAGTYAEISDDTLQCGQQTAFLKFRFEAITADELCPVLRREGEKTFYAADFTEEAKKLAEAFNVKLQGAKEVYKLVSESGCMPQTLLAPPEHKTSLKEKLSRRITRRAWRGYALSGTMLLLFSLVTVFPLYYIISGGILLAFSAFVRFFGKKED